METEIRHFHGSIAQILTEENPMGSGVADRDDYDAEAEAILKRLGRCQGSSHLQRILHQEFLLKFGCSPAGSLERYEASAERIWQVWKACSPEVVERVKGLQNHPAVSQFPAYPYPPRNEHVLTLVYVWATWNRIDFSMSDNLLNCLDVFDSSMKLQQVECDDNPERMSFLEKHRVLNIPALLLLRDGTLLEMSIGYKDVSALRELLSSWKEAHT